MKTIKYTVRTYILLTMLLLYFTLALGFIAPEMVTTPMIFGSLFCSAFVIFILREDPEDLDIIDTISMIVSPLVLTGVFSAIFIILS